VFPRTCLKPLRRRYCLPAVGVSICWGIQSKSCLMCDGWCRGAESNCLRPPFQGGALPVSYPGTSEFLHSRGAREACQFCTPRAASDSFSRIRRMMEGAEAWSEPGLFSQTVPKPPGAVGVSLWNPLRSGPSPLLLFHHISGLD
jgi:hypothetical protein